ncbi:MAG TPA: DNA primase large subunit PriL [Candidatus Thermoplasmatota archaeon]|nr:DNA primase large subunit PriL [Candidatus Thermoplasmatota archaeon]
MDPRLARYPFLPAAAEWMAREGPTLEEVLGDRVYATARARGRERVRIALEDATQAEAPPLDGSDLRELLEETLSYVYARILVSALADPYVVRRHALAEAVRVKAHLEREDDPEVVAECARAVGLGFEPDGLAFRAHFADYLRQAVHLKDMGWKLVRQPLRRGFVEMDRRTAARLVQEALRRRVEAELPRPVSDEVKARVAPDLQPLRELAASKKERYATEGAFGAVDLSILPPCMQHVLGQLQRGENVAHNARFAIVTFLHKIGMTSEDIMRLFAQAPDFREDLTRYQVEHITGVTSGTTYSVPGCDNLQTFNLCYADDLCRTRTRDGNARVRYPGDYYRYMHEVKPAVDDLARRVPLANPQALARAMAENYAVAKAFVALVQAPWLKDLTLADVQAVVEAHKLPLRIEDGKLVHDDADKRAILRLLESDWLKARLRTAPRA